MWVLSVGREDPLDQGMATCPSILDWKIPQTEEPGGLQSTWSQRVGYDRSDSAAVAEDHTHMCAHVQTCAHTKPTLFGKWYK